MRSAIERALRPKKACTLAVLGVAVVSASSAQTLTTIYNFACSNLFGCQVGVPAGSLAQGADGNFYGMTVNGGAYSYGSVFRLTPGGKFTTLHSFCPGGPNGACPDGFEPMAGLVLATNGNFYGTSYGGTGGGGVLFEVTPAGRLTPVCCSAAGPQPLSWGPLVQGMDSELYGTNATVFKSTLKGEAMTLYTICPGGCDGTVSGLLQASNGYFYGTTGEGGTGQFCGTVPFGCGTVFKITSTGDFTTLYSFCSQSSCTDGSGPYLGGGYGFYGNSPTLGTDGNIYGTTVYGGASAIANCYGELGCGTVFRITPGGSLTTLYNFCSQAGCPDGRGPSAGLVQGTDGNFYGSTILGGANNFGTVFRITPGGSLTTLYNFCSQAGCADGENPGAALIQGTDGNFYGTTEFGGANGDGTVFRLSVGLGPFVKTVPTSGKVGAPVTILGNNLTSATTVTFNGTKASFTVSSGTAISTTVPTGATTGFVTVSTPSGTLKSNVKFQVR